VREREREKDRLGLIQENKMSVSTGAERIKYHKRKGGKGRRRRNKGEPQSVAHWW
jgi:hypothetical protein